MDDEVTVVVKVIYGLKSDVVSFQNVLTRKLMCVLVLQLLLTGLYTWMNPYVKASSLKYYEYIFTHANNRMNIINEWDKIIKYLYEPYALGVLKDLFNENKMFLGISGGSIRCG